MLLDLVHARRLDPKVLITHRFKRAGVVDAYEVFAHAADNRALKVIIEAQSPCVSTMSFLPS